MALSVKTEEADRLARELALLTGETMTEAVTRALGERLEREPGKATADLPARVRAFTARVRPLLDARPVSPAEWDAACGDSPPAGRRPSPLSTARPRSRPCSASRGASLRRPCPCSTSCSPSWACACIP
jgi:antitoxin VapB